VKKIEQSMKVGVEKKTFQNIIITREQDRSLQHKTFFTAIINSLT